ncbi:MAG: hypothetical protein A2Y61_00290 [Chloroflexi bacterium RBG_13_60_13]|nr:MAG: hypothetical protein A2Y61_00290 [Chloroflexi bacterium RBG_13_60_13]
MNKLPEIDFNLRQACLIKNVGLAREDVFLLPAELNWQIQEALRCQALGMEFFLVNYLLEHPEVSHDDLVFEYLRAPVGEPGKHAIRRKGVGVIYEAIELKIRVVGD